MHLPPSKTLVFQIDGHADFECAEPTVGQIEALLALEEKLQGKSAGDARQSTITKLLILLVPQTPISNVPSTISHFFARRRAKKWLRQLTWPQLCVVLNTLLAAAQGIDIGTLEQLAAHATATAKKKVSPPPQPTTAATSTTSPPPSTNSPQPSAPCPAPKPSPSPTPSPKTNAPTSPSAPPSQASN